MFYPKHNQFVRTPSVVYQVILYRRGIFYRLIKLLSHTHFITEKKKF